MSEVMSEYDQLRAELDQLGEEHGEGEVRKRFVLGVWSRGKRPFIVRTGWRKRTGKGPVRQSAGAPEIQRQGASDAKEANEYTAKTNEHAAKANEHADKANCIAWFAFAAAAIATLIAAAALIGPVVGWLK